MVALVHAAGENVTVTLDSPQDDAKIRAWTTVDKVARIDLPAQWTPAQMPAIVYIEGIDTSGAQCDVTVSLTQRMEDNGAWADAAIDLVHLTCVSIEISTLGFAQDHHIFQWPTKVEIDKDDADPALGVPIWKRIGNPNDPVCYTVSIPVTMFGKFTVTPSISPGILGIQVLAKVNGTEIGHAADLILSDTEVDDAANADGDVDGIGSGSPVPDSDKVRTQQQVVAWDWSLLPNSWTRAGDTGQLRMHWAAATPLTTGAGDRLYDLALEKACGYANGVENAGIPGNVNTGIDGDILYNPLDRILGGHPLGVYDAGEAVCWDNARLMRCLMRSIGIEADIIGIWGGCGSGVICRYDLVWDGTSWAGGGLSPSFRSAAGAHDSAPATPHFQYHAQCQTMGGRYDPSYGTTGSPTLDEFAPAGEQLIDGSHNNPKVQLGTHQDAAAQEAHEPGVIRPGNTFVRVIHHQRRYRGRAQGHGADAGPQGREPPWRGLLSGRGVPRTPDRRTPNTRELPLGRERYDGGERDGLKGDSSWLREQHRVVGPVRRAVARERGMRPERQG
jgi:hypothetical protein